LLEFDDIWFKYSDDYVLRGVSGRVEKGKAIAIVGPTGSGKSTLLYVLSGLLEPEKGEVLLDGKRLAKKDVGLLFQIPDDQLFNPTVFDEISFALRTLGLNESVIKERVDDIAKRLGLTDLLHKSPFTLSVGQKKAVALASILVYNPKVLLLDEPSANVDRIRYEILIRTLSEELSKGKIVVITTHDIDVALELSHEICELEEGKLRCWDKKRYLNERIKESPVPIKISLRTLLELNAVEKILGK